MLIIAYCIQTKLIFHPGKLPAHHVFHQADSQPQEIMTADGQTISGLFFAGTKKDAVLYFHGNAGDLSNWEYVVGDFTQLGYSVFIIDYRGYGKSTGDISERGFYLDADAAYAYLIEKGFTPQQIIIYGRSIGTGVATDLASRKLNKGLILESPYTSLPDLATEKAPALLPRLILKYRFNTKDKIGDVKSPVIFFHGTEDTLIPPSHSDVLYERVRGQRKKFLIRGAGHNDINSFPEYHDALRGVLAELQNYFL